MNWSRILSKYPVSGEHLPCIAYIQHSIAESEQPELSSTVVSRVVTRSQSTKAEKVVGERAVGEQAVNFGSGEDVSLVLEVESDGFREGCAETEGTKDIVPNSDVSITESGDSNQSGDESTRMSEKVLETELLTLLLPRAYIYAHIKFPWTATGVYIRSGRKESLH